VLNCVSDVKDYRQLSPFLAFAVVRERALGSERELYLGAVEPCGESAAARRESAVRILPRG
jgi:hypothetical protein